MGGRFAVLRVETLSPGIGVSRVFRAAIWIAGAFGHGPTILQIRRVFEGFF